jgi:hypothetical protein
MLGTISNSAKNDVAIKPEDNINFINQPDDNIYVIIQEMITSVLIQSYWITHQRIAIIPYFGSENFN